MPPPAVAGIRAAHSRPGAFRAIIGPGDDGDGHVATGSIRERAYQLWEQAGRPSGRGPRALGTRRSRTARRATGCADAGHASRSNCGRPRRGRIARPRCRALPELCNEAVRGARALCARSSQLASAGARAQLLERSRSARRGGGSSGSSTAGSSTAGVAGVAASRWRDAQFGLRAYPMLEVAPRRPARPSPTAGKALPDAILSRHAHRHRHPDPIMARNAPGTRMRPPGSRDSGRQHLLDSTPCPAGDRPDPDSEEPAAIRPMAWYALCGEYSRPWRGGRACHPAAPHEAEQAADYLDRLDG